MQSNDTRAREYLLVSDFDQTLSFNDSGIVLSDLLGISGFAERIAGLSRIHLVQQGGELAYLLLHDPEYRCVRKKDLIETGKRIRLKENIRLLSQLLQDLDGHRFSFYVISAAPQEVIQSALEGIVAPDHVFGTELDFDPVSGETRAIVRVPAGYGKVAVLEELEQANGTTPDRTVYIGDGSSDVHVMLHVNNRDGFTVAVSENRLLTRIAQRTVLSDSAFSVLVPILQHVAGWKSIDIRAMFDAYGLPLKEWERVRTDWLSVGDAASVEVPGAATV